MSLSPDPTPPDADRVLVLDSDPRGAAAIVECLRSAGFAVTRGDPAGPGTACPEAPFHAAILEASGPQDLEMLRELRRRDRRIALLAIASFGTVEGAVAAMREGADDYLVKPLVDRELLAALRRAIDRRRMSSPSAGISTSTTLPDVLGRDPRMLKLQSLAASVAGTRATVLITGESGTGKSLIARAIHRASPRASGPFIEVSCGSIAETLLESELFGHVQGAFTGAIADRRGRLLAAHGGTLFLDEINSASSALQLKLLRVLQERTFEPVGSNDPIEVDVRIVLASNQPLERLVAEGRFRQDLYYRINVVPLEVPPLRDRKQDVPELAESFLRRFAVEHGRAIAGLDADAMRAMLSYAYPGNVRELENLIERAVVLCRGHLVTLSDLPETLCSGPTERSAIDGAAIAPAAATLGEALAEPERRILTEALRANGWNRTRTAASLGIDRTTLYKRMRRLGMGADRHAV